MCVCALVLTVVNVEWEGLQYVAIISACSVTQCCGNSVKHHTEKQTQSGTSAVCDFTNDVESSSNLKNQKVDSEESNTVEKRFQLFLALKIVIMDKPDFKPCIDWLDKAEVRIGAHVLLWTELGLQLPEVDCVTLPWKRALLYVLACSVARM